MKREEDLAHIFLDLAISWSAALCHGIARERKGNARKEKDRAAEIWKKKRRWERMREDVEFYLLENI